MPEKNEWLDELLRQDYLVKEENVDSTKRDKMYAEAIKSLKLDELVIEKINQERPKFDGLVSDEVFKDLQKQFSSTKITLQSLVKKSQI